MQKNHSSATDGRLLTFDFPVVKIGTAVTANDPTGCTIFIFPERVQATCDVRGGDPGVSEYQYSHYDAICFAGGSLRGLEVASGVRTSLMADYGAERDLVSAAVVNDGRYRENVRYPDKQLGLAAYRAAQFNRFPLGAVGAGRNVWVGGGRGRGVGNPEQAGQGGAFARFGAIKVAVFTVVNAFGAVVNRQGQLICGNVDPQSGRRIPYSKGLDTLLTGTHRTRPKRENTTLTLIVTNQAISARELRQVARQVHSSMARAIQPFHTLYDGDVLYMVTTGEVEDKHLDPVSLGILTSDLAWDAVLSCCGLANQTQ